jgi:hypothetical protein
MRGTGSSTRYRASLRVAAARSVVPGAPSHATRPAELPESAVPAPLLRDAAGRDQIQTVEHHMPATGDSIAVIWDHVHRMRPELANPGGSERGGGSRPLGSGLLLPMLSAFGRGLASGGPHPDADRTVLTLPLCE